MAKVLRSILVEYSAEEMRALVEDIESYAKFLPWCGGTAIVSRDAARTVATIRIDYRGIRQEFTTENLASPDGGIRIRLVSGPFRKLEGEWLFKALAPTASKVSLNLEYEFSGRLLDTVLGPVFHYITDSMVEAFVKRAEAIYGTR
jgi:hypothetical protein